MECIFCTIVEGAIPNYTVYEDEYSLAFLDIHPCVEGHTVVIPKQHGAHVFDFGANTLAHVMKGVQVTMSRLQDILKPDGFSVGWNHGKSAGQSVPHLHIHIIPRWGIDGGGSMHSIVRTTTQRPVADIAQLFS